MRSKHHHRPLRFEQLEPKAAPSSVLLLLSAGNIEAQPDNDGAAFVSTHSTIGEEYQFETEQLLRFIEESTADKRSPHHATKLPTPEQCEAADEMMSVVPGTEEGFLVLGFYDGGTEL